MPLPFILAGAALAAGAYGLKRGHDAKKDFEKAKEITEYAIGRYNLAKDSLVKERDASQEQLEALGRIKIAVYERGVIPFVDSFRKIKNIDYREINFSDDIRLAVEASEMTDIQDVAFKVRDLLESGIASLGSGALAGIAAFGGAGAFATASTGIAIGELAGVAATNATLAWFGGGSLAAGGLGMAGGTMVLGGIVAGPVLAVGGMMLASKAEKAVEDALSNQHQAEIAIEQIRTAEAAARGIHLHSREIAVTLKELGKTLFSLVGALRKLVEREDDFRQYSVNEKRLVTICASVAKTCKNILEVPIFDADGVITQASREALRTASECLEAVKSF